MSEKATMLGASTSCLGPPKHFSGWKNMDSMIPCYLPDTSWHFLTLPDTSICSFPISPFWAPFPFCSVHGLSTKNVKHCASTEFYCLKTWHLQRLQKSVWDLAGVRNWNHSTQELSRQTTPITTKTLNCNMPQNAHLDEPLSNTVYTVKECDGMGFYLYMEKIDKTRQQQILYVGPPPPPPPPSPSPQSPA